MTTFVMRHAPTEHNDPDPAKEKIRGWGNASLSEEGRVMAREAGQKLKDKHIQLIFSSDLPRAHETAKLVSEELGGIQVIPLEEFRTWNVGKITGQPVRQAKPVLDDLQHHRPTKAAPGGESYAAFYKRWGMILRQLVKLGLTRNILAVVHGRQVYSLPNLLKDKGPQGVPTHGEPHPGDVLEIDDKAKTSSYVHRSGSAARATA